MKPSWLVVATFLGLGTYLFLELLVGQYGLVAFRVLQRFRERAVVELEEVQDRTELLRREVRLLTTDGETVHLEARDIGLVGENEVVVRIGERDPRSRHRYQPGAVPARMPRVRDHRPLFRSIGFSVFLIVLLVELVGVRGPAAWIRRRKKRRREIT